MEDTKWVSNIEEGQTSKKTPMWTITWHDGKSDKIFKEDWVITAKEALANEWAVHYKKEQNDKGYWNITELALVKDVLPPPVKPPEAVTPDDTRPKTIKPDSKNRAFALSYAKDYVIAKLNKGEEQNVNDVVICAEVFLQYLDGNITPDVAKVISALNKK